MRLISSGIALAMCLGVSQSSVLAQPVFTPAQRSLEEAVDASLLRAGLDAIVLAHSDGTWKILEIDMYLNRPLVDQIVRQLDLLNRAKAVGFEQVKFLGKGSGQGVWRFQISGPRPWCSISLCY